MEEERVQDVDGRKDQHLFAVSYLYHNRFKKTDASGRAFVCREHCDPDDKFMEI